MEFKPGDKVLCIGMLDYYSDKLKVDKIYTVGQIYTNISGITWIRVKENKEINSYEIKYFRQCIKPESFYE